jgi:hypothetical protein
VLKSVRVDDISELSLVPSISVYSMIWLFCVCWCYVLRWIWCCDVTLRACSYGQKLSRLARKLFDKFTSEISPCYENNMKSYIAFIWDEKFSRVPRSRLLTGEISVTGIMFSPYEHNISTTFPLSGKTFCRVSNFSIYTLQNGGRRNSVNSMSFIKYRWIDWVHFRNYARGREEN